MGWSNHNESSARYFSSMTDEEFLQYRSGAENENATPLAHRMMDEQSPATDEPNTSRSPGQYMPQMGAFTTPYSSVTSSFRISIPQHIDASTTTTSGTPQTATPTSFATRESDETGTSSPGRTSRRSSHGLRRLSNKEYPPASDMHDILPSLAERQQQVGDDTVELSKGWNSGRSMFVIFADLYDNTPRLKDNLMVKRGSKNKKAETMKWLESSEVLHVDLSLKEIIPGYPRHLHGTGARLLIAEREDWSYDKVQEQ